MAYRTFVDMDGFYWQVLDSQPTKVERMLSPGMSREWVQAETYIPAITNWGIGSDHRPLLATFEATDK